MSSPCQERCEFFYFVLDSYFKFFFPVYFQFYAVNQELISYQIRIEHEEEIA